MDTSLTQDSRVNCLLVGTLAPPVTDHSTRFQRLAANLAAYMTVEVVPLGEAIERRGRAGLLLRAGQLLQLALKAYRRASRADVVYVSMGSPKEDLLRVTLVLLIGHLLRKRTVLAVGDGAPVAWATGPIRAIWRTAWRYVVPSEGFRHKVTLLGPEAAQRVDVIGEGTSDVVSEPRTAPATRLHLLYLGDLRHGSGYQCVVDAIMHLRRLRPDCDVRLVLAGTMTAADGDNSLSARLVEARMMLKSARYLDVEGQVEAMPAVRSAMKRRLIEEADALILPFACPEAGVFRACALDGMAAGLPLITTRHLAVDALEDGVNCLLVVPNSPVEIARAASRLTDGALYEKLSRNALDVARQYSDAPEVARLAALLRSGAKGL